MIALFKMSHLSGVWSLGRHKKASALSPSRRQSEGLEYRLSPYPLLCSNTRHTEPLPINVVAIAWHEGLRSPIFQMSVWRRPSQPISPWHGLPNISYII